MIRHLVFRLCLMAMALIAAPLGAQTVAEPLDRARTAEARLEFAAALSALAEAIALRPDDPAAYLARANLHRKMNRPALALADLGAVLADDATNTDALHARAGLYLALGALSRAAADFDSVLAAAPDDVAALVGRARARTRSGLTALALADYDAALALAPGTPGLAEEHATLAGPALAGLRYDPAALMDPAFVVTQGAPTAKTRLIIVHAGNDLSREEALLPLATLAPALASGAIGVTHLFTYTGQDSAIWANLALICAGPEGFGPTWEVLAGEPARAALAAIDAGHGRDDFEALVASAYAQAGLDPGRGADCAFSRAKALGYLADWTDKREAETWRGSTFYDAWPVFVLDGTVVSAAEVRGVLAGLAPTEAEDPAQTGQEAPPGTAETPPQGPLANIETDIPPGIGEQATQTEAGGAAPATDRDMAGELVTEPGTEAAPDLPPSAKPAPEAAPLPAGLGPVDDTANIPAELRGIWAPSLVECIAYDEAVESADRLDTALPEVNPLDGPPIGTVLLTSRRMLLFNAVATSCDLVSVTSGNAAPFSAQLACRNGVAPGIVVPMTLARIENTGPAPRLGVNFGRHGGIELVQCRPLGALGRTFAPLWQIDPERCRVSAPVTGARFDFAALAGTMVLTIMPDPAPDEADGSALTLALDGASLATTGVWQSGAWQIDLGQFAAMADGLAKGLLLKATAAAPGESGTLWTRTLPLLGSGRAMAALAACADG